MTLHDSFLMNAALRWMIQTCKIRHMLTQRHTVKATEVATQ